MFEYTTNTFAMVHEVSGSLSLKAFTYILYMLYEKFS